MRTKIFSIAFFSALLLTLNSFAGALTNQWSYTDQMDETVSDACAGEDIAFQGPIHFNGSEVITPSGHYHLTLHSNYQGVSGVGQTSGDTYNLVSGTSNNLNIDFGTNGGEGTFIQNIHVISNGVVYDATVRAHITVTPNGDVTVNFNEITFQCN